MFKWLNPWKALRDRKEAKRIEDDRIATAKAMEQHERAARVLAASIERSRKPTLRAVAPLSARQAVIDEQMDRLKWQAEQDRKALDRMRDDEDRRRRNASSDAEGSFATSDYLATLLQTRREEAKSFAGDGGTFGGGGASGDWDRMSSSTSSDSGTCSTSSSDSGSSSSDSGSSSSSCSSDSGSSGGGGD